MLWFGGRLSYSLLRKSRKLGSNLPSASMQKQRLSLKTDQKKLTKNHNRKLLRYVMHCAGSGCHRPTDVHERDKCDAQRKNNDNESCIACTPAAGLEGSNNAWALTTSVTFDDLNGSWSDPSKQRQSRQHSEISIQRCKAEDISASHELELHRKWQG